MKNTSKNCFEKKLKINQEKQTTWDNHYVGWEPAINILSNLHNDEGIRFIGYMDEIVAFEEIKEDFVGFFHHTPKSPDYIENSSWSKNLKGLEFYFSKTTWKKNESKCKGIFVLCNYLKKYIQTKTYCPVSSVYHPITKQTEFFTIEKFKNNKNKILLHPGNWLRNFDAFNKLKSPYVKTITGQWSFKNPNQDIAKLGFLTKEQYREILTKNIVFQNYYDVSASNTILECIAMNVPIIVNRLPANEEYLGANYPLFYDSLNEAENFLNDERSIEKGYEYIKVMDKSKFEITNFLKSFCFTDVYKDLKKPSFI